MKSTPPIVFKTFIWCLLSLGCQKNIFDLQSCAAKIKSAIVMRLQACPNIVNYWRFRIGWAVFVINLNKNLSTFALLI